MSLQPDKNLIDQLKNSIAGMQDQMKNTYEQLSSSDVTGQSAEKPTPYVKIILKANYEFVDIQFEKNALEGGVGEFKFRIKTAFNDAIKQIQKITQEKTMQLLQGMNMPPHLQQSLGKNDDDDEA